MKLRNTTQRVMAALAGIAAGSLISILDRVISGVRWIFG